MNNITRKQLIETIFFYSAVIAQYTIYLLIRNEFSLPISIKYILNVSSINFLIRLIALLSILIGIFLMANLQYRMFIKKESIGFYQIKNPDKRRNFFKLFLLILYTEIIFGVLYIIDNMIK